MLILGNEPEDNLESLRGTEICINNYTNKV